MIALSCGPPFYSDGVVDWSLGWSASAVSGATIEVSYGDGSTGTATGNPDGWSHLFRHQYPGPGSYNVTAVVEDELGQFDIDSCWVNIYRSTTNPTRSPECEMLGIHCYGNWRPN